MEYVPAISFDDGTWSVGDGGPIGLSLSLKPPDVRTVLVGIDPYMRWIDNALGDDDIHPIFLARAI